MRHTEIFLVGRRRRVRPLTLRTMEILRAGRALASALGQTISSGRVHPDWTVAQSVVVRTMRVLLEGLVEEGADVHRSALDVAGPGAPTAVTVSEEVGANGQPRSVFRPPSSNEDARIVHFHGGGYVVGYPGKEAEFLGQLAMDVGCPVVAAGYRLAPEHSSSDALDDAMAEIRAVLDKGVAPERVVLWGDSAGGGLVLRALCRLRDEGGPTLGGAVLGSPWVEMASDSQSFHANAEWDYLPPKMVQLWASWTHPNPADPSVSPVRGELSNLPPLLLLAGALECFRDDIRRCADRVREGGGTVELLEAELAVHCWYLTSMLPGDSGVRVEAVDRIRSWVGAAPDVRSL